MALVIEESVNDKRTKIVKNEHDESNESEDVESFKGRFEWKIIGGCLLPFITRIVGQKREEFVSVRMAVSQLLNAYSDRLHDKIFKCASVNQRLITGTEAKLLNDIHRNHAEYLFDGEPYLSGEDCVMRLDDLKEFCAFLELCYDKLMCNVEPDRPDRCGFIRIDGTSVVPYCYKDDRKYVPLFYFDGKTEDIRSRAVELERWDLAYLKFCFEVQGIVDENVHRDSCAVVSLEDVRQEFPPGTVFEDFWPASVVDKLMATKQSNAFVHEPDEWFRAPLPKPRSIAVEPDVILSAQPSPPSLASPPLASRPLASSFPASPPLPVAPASQAIAPASSVPVSFNSNQTVNPHNPRTQPPLSSTYSCIVHTSCRDPRVAGQQYYNMVNSYKVRTQQPFATSTANFNPISPRDPRIAAQFYASDSIVSQQYNISQGIALPPNVSAGFLAPVSYSASYSNIAPMTIQPKTSSYSPMSLMNCHTEEQMLQPEQKQEQPIEKQQKQLSKDQHQQMVYPSLEDHVYNAQFSLKSFSNDGFNYSQQQITHDLIHRNDNSNGAPSLKIQKIPDRSRELDGQLSSNTSPYTIHEVKLLNKVISCINASPFTYSESDLLVTLNNLVQVLLPTCDVWRCAYLLNYDLKTMLFSGNSEQIAVLRKSGQIGPNESTLLMVKLSDLSERILLLMALVTEQDYFSSL